MKLVMFDMDGTLTDSYALDESCYVVAIQQVLGLAKVVTEWETYTHASSSFCFAEIARRGRGSAPTEAESAAVQRRLIELMDDIARRRGRCTWEISGAAACLAELRRRGYAVAIATGDWRLTAHHKLTAAGIPHADVPSAFCDDSHVRTEIMRTALERARRHYDCQEFERVVYVGDGAWDVRACRELGWPLIGIGSGDGGRRLTKLGVRHVLAGYEPAAPFFAALETATVPQAAQPERLAS